MSGFRILSTNHTSFTVSDLDRTVAFFRDGLGFELTSRSPRSQAVMEGITGLAGASATIAFLQGPGHRIELVQYHGPDDRGAVAGRPCDAGFAHVAFDVDDMDAAVATAERYGFRPFRPPMTVDRGPNAGGRAVYLRDGDGVALEFIQPPKR